ncbi:protein of unknown function [Pseudodesulfovibrio profundus]|uniref:Uncharacterized protein n=1 Tax=Pseudodesulfovibrio profundus TaxID=57320 RepID=A0A2C8F829_9BACT|nr:protein of unknown function [Pseudodesulfovibrio profundus]
MSRTIAPSCIPYVNCAIVTTITDSYGPIAGMYSSTVLLLIVNIEEGDRA